MEMASTPTLQSIKNTIGTAPIKETNETQNSESELKRETDIRVDLRPSTSFKRTSNGSFDKLFLVAGFVNDSKRRKNKCNIN